MCLETSGKQLIIECFELKPVLISTEVKKASIIMEICLRRGENAVVSAFRFSYFRALGVNINPI
jgi:hypothetical protein